MSIEPGKWYRTKSGRKSARSGERYLPRKVRMLLTEDEYARSTQKKKQGDDQFVDQPDDVKEKVAHIKEHGPTKDMLMTRAQDLDIEGRSSMTKDELLALENKTKDELYEMAQERDIDGRSDMTKDELVAALTDR